MVRAYAVRKKFNVSLHRERFGVTSELIRIRGGASRNYRRLAEFFSGAFPAIVRDRLRAQLAGDPRARLRQTPAGPALSTRIRRPQLEFQ